MTHNSCASILAFLWLSQNGMLVMEFLCDMLVSYCEVLFGVDCELATVRFGLFGEMSLTELGAR